MLHDPFARSALPSGVIAEGQDRFSRETRVRLLGEAARALLNGQLPDGPARLFLAGGLASWLEADGDLLRDYWRIKAPAGSHRTPSQLWRRCSSRGATSESKSDTFEATTSPEPTT